MTARRARVRFAPFEFDAASGELWRDGRRVRLQRQPARLLELLLSNAGRVVSREEIRQALWGGDVHVDFERSLNFCVRKLRESLEDDAAKPRFVETLPTRGYRFIAAAEQTAAAPAEYVEDKAAELAEYAAQTAAVRAEHAEQRSAEHAEYAGRTAAERADVRPGILKWALVVAILIGVTAGLFIGHHKTGPDTPKIVVIPFHNETGSPDFDRVAKGVSDAAVAQLATSERISHLRVIGNASDVFFSFRPRDMKAMGEALGAQSLVLGQLKKDRTRFRVIAHLIRVSDQTHVWATTFDRDSLDLPTQSAIAEDIAKAVASHLSS